jgi:hypothetical protein
VPGGSRLKPRHRLPFRLLRRWLLAHAGLAARAVSTETARVTSDRPQRFACQRFSHICPRCSRCSREESIAIRVRERASWSWRPTLLVSDGAITRRVGTRCWHSSRVWSMTTPPTRARSRLAELIRSVIGLTGDDLHIDALITLRCATIALPVTAGADRQRVLGLDSGLWEGAGTTRWTPKAQPLYRYSARASRSAPSGAMGRALHEQRSSLATSLPPAGRTAWCPVRNRGCRTRAIHRVTSARCQLRP